MRLQKVTLLWTREDERQENLKTKRLKKPKINKLRKTVSTEKFRKKGKEGKTRQELLMSRSSWKRSSIGKLPPSHYFGSSPH